MANYTAQLQSIGYKFDPNSTNGLNGYQKINGFSFFVQIMPSAESFVVSATCRPQNEGEIIELNKYLEQYVADRKKKVNLANFCNNTISISYKMGIHSNVSTDVKEATDAIIYFINQCGCIPVCSQCGQNVYTDIYSVSGNPTALCPNCFSSIQNSILMSAQSENQTITNIPLGILGAALGGLIGAVIWILFSMLGKIVFLAGFAAGALGIFGFQKLGKKLTKSGLFISIAISFVMLLAGMYFAIAIDIYNAYKDYISFSDSFSLIPYVFQDSEILPAIIRDWGIGIITYIISVIVCAIQFFKEKKVKYKAVKLT